MAVTPFVSTDNFTMAEFNKMITEINNGIDEKAPAYQYSTTDLTAGTSALATGTLYFVYE